MYRVWPGNGIGVRARKPIAQGRVAAPGGHATMARARRRVCGCISTARKCRRRSCAIAFTRVRRRRPTATGISRSASDSATVASRTARSTNCACYDRALAPLEIQQSARRQVARRRPGRPAVASRRACGRIYFLGDRSTEARKAGRTTCATHAASSSRPKSRCRKCP